MRVHEDIYNVSREQLYSSSVLLYCAILEDHEDYCHNFKVAKEKVTCNTTQNVYFMETL